MKKILFLNYDRKIDHDYFGKKYENTTELMRDYLYDYDVDFRTYKDFNLVEDVPYVFNRKLTDYSFIFFGFISDFTNDVELIMSYVRDSKVPFMKYGDFQYKDNKAYEMKIIKEAGLPYIPSILYSDLSRKLLLTIKEKVFPIVAKPIYGSKGKGVTLITNNKNIRRKLNDVGTPALVQPFIENNGDYRVVVINHKAEVVYKRVRLAGTTEFRNNVYQGSKIEKSELPSEIIEKIEKFSVKIDCDIVGFDILWDGTEKWYIMEYNSAPSFLKSADELNINIVEKICNAIRSKVQE